MLLDPVDELVAANADAAHAEPVDGKCAERPLDLRVSETHELADLSAVQVQGRRRVLVAEPTATVRLQSLRGAFRHARERNRRLRAPASPMCRTPSRGAGPGRRRSPPAGRRSRARGRRGPRRTRSPRCGRMLPAHNRQHGAGDVYRAHEVRRELPRDQLRRQVLEAARDEDARVVDEHVDAASWPVATTASPAASAARAKCTPMPRPAPVMSQTPVSVIASPGARDRHGRGPPGDRRPAGAATARRRRPRSRRRPPR